MWRRILLAGVLAVMLLLAALMLVGYVVQRQTDAEIIRISKAGQPLTFRDLEKTAAAPTQSTVPRTPGLTVDAAQLYSRVLSQIPAGTLEKLKEVNLLYRKSILALPPENFPGDLRQQVRENLTKLAPALSTLDQGAQLPLAGFDMGVEYGKDACKARLESAQTACYLLSLRTLEAILNGDGLAGLNSIISTLRLIRVFDTQPVFIVSAAKVFCVGLACEDIRTLLQQSTPTQDSLARLQKALEQAMPENQLEKMLLTERVYQLELARDYFSEDIASDYLQKQIPPIRERLSLPVWSWQRLRVRLKSIRYLREMHWLITSVARPWPQPLDLIAPSPDKRPAQVGRLTKSVAPLVHLTASALALQRCSILALAVKRYIVLNGAAPASLDELCPAFIDSVPLDPFTGNKLLYTHDAETCTIYSAAINRKDDGGLITPSSERQIPPDRGLNIPIAR